MTNPVEAHANFVAKRLNGQDTTSSQHYSMGSGNTGFFQKYRIPIFAKVAGVLALTGAVSLVARRRKPLYGPLYDPAPLGDMPMQHIMGYGAPAPDSDLWTSRR